MTGMSDVERFAANAARAEEMARQMTNDDQRMELMNIAAEWRRLAQAARSQSEAPKPNMP